MKILVVFPPGGGGLVVARHAARALRKMGHTLEILDSSREIPAYKIALRAVEDEDKLIALYSRFLNHDLIVRALNFEPDLILAFAGSPVAVGALKLLRKQGFRLACWYVEDYRYITSWRETAACYDFFFTIQRGDFFEELKRAGIRSYHYLPNACAPEVHRPEEISEVKRPRYGSHLSFVGAPYPNRVNMFKLLIDFDLGIWGEGWGSYRDLLGDRIRGMGHWVSEETANIIYNSSKIALNLHSSTTHDLIDPDGDFVNPRTFALAASGCFQLVDYRSPLDELFEPDGEIIVYRSPGELREMIERYLRSPEESRRITVRARERVLREHTYERRMEYMMEVIRSDGSKA